jgi:hypothetical protein
MAALLRTNNSRSFLLYEASAGNLTPIRPEFLAHRFGGGRGRHPQPYFRFGRGMPLLRETNRRTTFSS